MAIDIGRAILGSSISPTVGLIAGKKKDPNQNQRPGLSQADIIKGQEARAADIEAGRQFGRDIFYDPEMTQARGRLEDLSKGYSGRELGAIRGQALSELQGQRGGYLRQLASKAARGGVGGARAAAMQGAADRGFMGQRAQMERGMAADQAKMVREGNQQLQEFLLRQKYGELSSGLGLAQMGAGERGALLQAQAAANRPQSTMDRLMNPFGMMDTIGM